MASGSSKTAGNRAQKLKPVDEEHKELSEGSPYPLDSSTQPHKNVVRNIRREFGSPTPESTPQNYFRSARIVQSMVDDDDVTTLDLARSMDEVVLNSCYEMRGHIIAAGNP